LNGGKIVAVSEAFGVSRQSLSTWMKSYRAGGEDSLESGKRGRKNGEKRKLNEQQSKEIVKVITDHLPEQLKMPFVLWTRKAVQQLIYERFKLRLPIRSVGNYLNRWGFTPQKPAKSSYEQQPTQVKQWLDQVYPVIRERAKNEGAEIHWGDETGFKNESHVGRSFAPKGKTPVVKKQGKRFSTNMISTVTNQGKLRFMIYDSTMTWQVMIEFLTKLIKGSNNKIFLILDNLRVHHAKALKLWIEQHKESIELFFLPSYSPELNPDEYLNCDVKVNANSKRTPRNEEQLKSNLRSHMIKLQKTPERVKSYFQNKHIAYAAA
jgi:transposase